MFGIHFGPLDSLDNEGRGIDGTVVALRGRFEPVIMLSRHQHEFAPTVTGNFHRLVSRLVLEFPDFRWNSRAVVWVIAASQEIYR